MGVLNAASRRVRAAGFVLGLAAAAATPAMLPVPANATSLELYGFGPRAAGMGLTGTVTSDGPWSLYYNPAGLTELEGIEIGSYYQMAPTRLALNGRSIGAREPRATDVGLGFGLSTFGRRSGLALALHVPDAGLYGVRIRPVHRPHFAVVDPRRDRVHVIAGYAIEPVDKVQIGIGSSLLSDTVARMRISQTGEQRADMDARLLPTQTLHAGVRVGPFANVRAGLSYREEHVSILSFPTDLSADVAGIRGDVLVRARAFVYFTPRQVSAGAAWEKEGLTATADLVWSQWSAMPDPYGDSSLTVIDHGGTLPPSPPPTFAEDPRFRDTLSPHLGAEWRALRGGGTELALRAGYAFAPSPAPRPSATRNLVDLDRHVATLGARVSFREPPVLTGPLDLEAYAGYTHMPPRTVLRDDPTDPVGAYTASGALWAFGLGATFHFDAAYLRD